MGGLDFLDPLLRLDGTRLSFFQGARAVTEGGVEFADVGALDEHGSHDVREIIHGDRFTTECGQFFVGSVEFGASSLEVEVPFFGNFGEVVPRGFATDGLDAADAGCDGSL